jgi:hypothetical protein
MARPMPRLPPVTRALRPVRSNNACMEEPRLGMASRRRTAREIYV